MAGETAEAVEALARQLFAQDEPGGVFEYADYPVQAHYRRQAQRQLQQQAIRDRA